MHAKKSHVIEASTKACRWILIALLPCDLAFTIALLAHPSGNDDTFEESEDLNYAAVRLATSAITAALSILSLLIALPRYKLVITRRMLVLFSLRVISVMLIVPDLAYPTPVRTAITVILLSLIFIELVVISIVFVKISKVNREFYGRKERESSVGALLKEVKKDPTHFVEALDEWLLLKDSRKMLRRKYQVAQTGWALSCAAVLLIGFVIFVIEFGKIASTQNPLYKDHVINEMNHRSRTEYFNGTRDHSTSQSKVLVVVLDGYRYDYLYKNDEMLQFLYRDDVAPHAKILKMHAQLPSMSVPNWVTLLTGAPPEATGVLGNLLVPETDFDSMFRQAANAGLMRGLTGSPWFSAIIDSTLPFLEGDGTIPTTLGAGGKQTSDFADDERMNVAKLALTQRSYPLFLAHFSDVDIQGHCCGVTKKYNEKDTYYEAATNKSILLNQIVDFLDNDTVMFVVADHGHVDVGGHGGVDKKLLEVPLVVFKKNSFLASRTFNGPRFEPPALNFDTSEEEGIYYNNLDLAPTVCAILGIPVPRQSHGKFIDDAMLFVPESNLYSAYYDLYEQKKSLVEAFIETSQPSNPPKLPTLALNLSLEEYKNTVNDLLGKREDMRQETLSRESARNVVATTVICIFLGCCVLFLLQHVTFASPKAIFTRRPSVVRRKNALAAFWSFLVVFVYYGLSILIYWIAFRVIGYNIWDSTVIHYPGVLTRYALITLVPAVVVMYSLVRAVHIFYTVMPTIQRHNFSMWANPLFLGKNILYRDVGFIVLFRYYLAWWTVVSWLLLLILESAYTFIIPPVFAIKFITTSLWIFRFRILTVQLMSLPLVFGSIILLYFGLPSRNANRAHFDQIYLLKITKDLLRAGHPTYVEDISQIRSEDTILQKHKNSIFYTAILDELALNRFARVNTIYEVTSVAGDTQSASSSTEFRKLDELALATS